MNAVQRLNVDGSKYFFGLSYSPIPFEVSLLASFKEVKCLKNIFIKYPEREGNTLSLKSYTGDIQILRWSPLKTLLTVLPILERKSLALSSAMVT